MSKAALVLMMALIPVLSKGKKIYPDDENNTFECSPKEADKLEHLGAAKRVEIDTVNDDTIDPLSKLKKEELEALAVERKVTFPDGVKTKAEMVAFLNSPEGQGEA